MGACDISRADVVVPLRTRAFVKQQVLSIRKSNRISSRIEPCGTPYKLFQKRTCIFLQISCFICFDSYVVAFFWGPCPLNIWINQTRLRYMIIGSTSPKPIMVRNSFHGPSDLSHFQILHQTFHCGTKPTKYDWSENEAMK